MFPNLRILGAFIFIIIPLVVFGQNESDLVTALNRQLIPLTTVLPDSNFNDLEKLKSLIKDKQVFGLGEATHGTHEFFEFKHRMLEFLVKEVGVKTFVIEADFAGTQLMNDYVLYGKGDVNKGLAGMGFGVWMTQEVVDMANWIKAYNATQPLENKVKFFGCDMQWGSSAMQFLKDYLSPTNRFTPAMEEGFAAMKKYTPTLTKQEKAAIRNSVKELADVNFTDVDSGSAAIYRHDIRELQQFQDYMDAQSTFFPARQSDVRDKYMAENCEWIYNYTGHQKMMIWAHNEHIKKTSGSDSHLRMGMFLSEVWHDAYYAMGFDFYSGKMRAFDMQQKKTTAVELPLAKAKSLGAILSQCAMPNFILDFKSASTNPVIGQFLSSKVPSVFYGASYSSTQAPYYVTHKLSDTYDSIIFIRETSAAKEIQK